MPWVLSEEPQPSLPRPIHWRGYSCPRPTDAADKHKPTAHMNFTDTGSHNRKGADGWIQGYTPQAALDSDMQVIL